MSSSRKEIRFMNINFRLLRAEEIEVRIASCNRGGVQLLLYKSARVDANILDETVGNLNWSKTYTRDNHNCILSIWDSEKNCWIQKEDTGTESYSEAEKGLASDSFKRAGFAFGIGRELYTAPNIFIFASDLVTYKDDGMKCRCYDSFRVVEVVYNHNRTINSVVIENLNTHRTYRFENPTLECKTIILDAPVPQEAPTPTPAITPQAKTDLTKMKEQKTNNSSSANVNNNTTIQKPKKRITKKQQEELLSKCNNDCIDVSLLFSLYNVQSVEDVTDIQYKNMQEHWDKIIYQCSSFF